MSASVALLKEVTDEMDHELFRAIGHPALGIDCALVGRWRNKLASVVYPSITVSEPAQTGGNL